jgi:hypothetical protein
MKIDEKRLGELLDKEAIREALVKYTRGMDRHDDDIMQEAYHLDGTDDHNTFIGSSTDYIKHANIVHSMLCSAHQHYISNQTIDLDGDRANTETYFLAALRQKTGQARLVGGRYLDRFERRDNHWAIAHRTALIEWSGDLAGEDNLSILDSFNRGTWDKSDPSYKKPYQLEREARDLILS